MGVHTEAVQKLYVAYFNRPADYTGLKFWEEKMAAGVSLEAIANSFAQSPEYKQTYAGKTNFEIINQIYLNLFNREADLGGAEHWDRLLTNGTFTIDEIVTIIGDTATDTEAKDKTTLANKIAAATAFSAQLDTVAEAIGYGGDKANQAAKNWLSEIGTKESLDAALQPAALAAAVAAVANTGLASAGSTQTLTTGVDTLIGTSGNDTFVAVIGKEVAGQPSTTTLTALDTITGGAGVDTLQINALVDIEGDLPSVTVSGVEIVSIRGAGSVAANVTGFTGIEQLNVTEARGDVGLKAGATTNIAATVKAYEDSAVRIAGGKDVTVRVTDNANSDNTITVGYEGTAAKGTVNVESVGKAAVLGSGGIEMGDINVEGGTIINVNQVANGSTAALGNGSATTHVQGDIYIYGNTSTTTVNVKQTATVGAQPGIAAVAETTEVASVKFSALVKGQSLTVAGLTFTAAKNLTAAEVAKAFSNLAEVNLPVDADGDTQGSGLAANGTYTGSIEGWTSAAANGDTVVFTSTVAGDVDDLKFTGSAAFTPEGATTATPAATVPTPVTTTQGVDEEGNTAVLGVQAGYVSIDDDTGTIKTVTVDGYGDYDFGEGDFINSQITDSTALANLSLSNSLNGFYVEDTAATLNLTLNKIGTARTSLLDATDALITLDSAPTTLNVKSTGNNYIDLDARATENLNVSGTGTLKADVVDLASLKTIVVTETAGLNTGATLLGAVTSVTTTGTTGSTTVAIDGNKATYTGGAGVDSVTVHASTTSIAKSISLGAGNDRLDLTGLDASKLAATASTVSLDGGEGTADVIALSAAAAAGVSTASGFEARFSNFERLEVGKATGNVTVNLDFLDDINYVITKGTGGSSAATALGVTKTEGRAATSETATVAFANLGEGETFIVAGRTVTAGVGGATAAQVAAAFATGTSTAAVTVDGNYTGYTAGAASGSLVTFTSTTTGNVFINLSVGGTGTGAQVNVTNGVDALTESNIVEFKDMAAGQSITVAGRTITASGTATAAQVAAAFLANASAGNLTVSGTLSGWGVADNTATEGSADVVFTSSTPGANVTDLAQSIVISTASASGTLTLDKMLNDATVRMDAATTVEVKLADATGTADVVNLIANGNATHTATVAKVETINITANDTVSGSGVSTDTVNLAADSATTVKVSGAGNLVLNLGTVTKVVTSVDGSAATGNLKIASSTATDAVAVTITGGSGNDVLTASGNKADVLIGGAGDDTLVAGSGLATLTGGQGNDLFKIGVASANVNSYATVTDFAAGDLIQFVGATSFTSQKVSLGETAVFQDYANAAINALALGQIGWFQLGGNTYVVADMGSANGTTGFVNGEDFIVKLTGTVDLSNASFNSDFGTIGLI